MCKDSTVDSLNEHLRYVYIFLYIYKKLHKTIKKCEAHFHFILYQNKNACTSYPFANSGVYWLQMRRDTNLCFSLFFL